MKSSRSRCWAGFRERGWSARRWWGDQFGCTGQAKRMRWKASPANKNRQNVGCPFAGPETRVRLPCLPLAPLTFFLLGGPFVLANHELSSWLVGEILRPRTKYYLFLIREGALMLFTSET